LSIIQGPFSVAPCQTLALRFRNLCIAVRSRFLEAWWKAGGQHEGRPDHAVLDWMYRDDQLGVQAKLRVVNMEAMNGGLGTYQLPAQQPVMHLVAMSDDLRLQVTPTLTRFAPAPRVPTAPHRL
jgi:hypothetical protein